MKIIIEQYKNDIDHVERFKKYVLKYFNKANKIFLLRLLKKNFTILFFQKIYTCTYIVYICFYNMQTYKWHQQLVVASVYCNLHQVKKDKFRKFSQHETCNVFIIIKFKIKFYQLDIKVNFFMLVKKSITGRVKEIRREINNMLK